MALNLNVTPDELRRASKTEIRIMTDYLAEVKSMYQKLDELSTNWLGAGSSQYYTSIMNRKPEVEELGRVMGQYGIFFDKTAIAYENTDNNIASAATKL